MTGFPAAPVDHADAAEHRRRIAECANRALAGKLNATGSVTLTPNAATTGVADARVGVSSWIGFMPLSANAAAELGNGTLYLSAQANGDFTIAHANNAQADRSFRYLVIG